MKRRRVFLLIAVCCAVCSFACAQKGFFSSRLPVSVLNEIVQTSSQFRPLPKAGDTAWRQLPESVKKAYVEEAEKRLGKTWEVVNATEFLAFGRSGNRLSYEFKLFDQRSRLEFAVIAELMENKGRFMDEIVNGVWKICEESWWGVPAHSETELPDVNGRPFVDLFDSETAQMMSWIYYLMKDKLDEQSPMIANRILTEVKGRMLTQSRLNDYGWKTGHDNWTTWISSNWLAAVLLIEDNRENQIEAIGQILAALDGFYENYPEDGGCDEGPAYWNRAAASLFESLYLLRMASEGAIDFSSDEKIKKMGAYIWKMHISHFYFVNFADARPVIIPNVSSMYRFGQYTNDDQLKKLARYIAVMQDYKNTTLPNSNYIKFNDRAFLYGFGRQLFLLMQIDDVLKGDAAPPLVKSVWLDKLQLFTARNKANSSDGFYFAAKGGHNGESHNHNDVGSFCLYANGLPLLVDLGVEQYTKKTFGKNRYDIWTMQSAYHNLPTINGVMQKEGREFRARHVKNTQTDTFQSFSLDIANAYPKEAGVKSWKRGMTLTQSNEFIVTETYHLENVNDNTFISLMVYGDVLVDRDRSVFIKAKDGRTYSMEYDKKQLKVSCDFLPVEDNWLKVAWETGINRLKLELVDRQKTGKIGYRFKELRGR